MATAQTRAPNPVRQAWLDRWQEPITDPELPIVDPHHHLWDRPGWRYLLDELLADLKRGYRIVATVFLQCRAMHRADGPEALRPVGETEFVNGVAAMSASAGYGPTAICAGIVARGSPARRPGRPRSRVRARRRSSRTMISTPARRIRGSGAETGPKYYAARGILTSAMRSNGCTGCLWRAGSVHPSGRGGVWLAPPFSLPAHPALVVYT